MSNTRYFTRTLLLAFALAVLTSIALAADPGTPIPATSASSDQKPGSVLVYNLFTSKAGHPELENTAVTVTNTNPTAPVAVHVFIVNSNDCAPTDYFICLTQSQTATFLASDVDPGVTGYVIMVAVGMSGTAAAGCPISFNYLIGEEYVKLDGSNHEANLPAESFAALYQGALPGYSSASTSAVIAFDGVSYNQAPRVLALSKVPSMYDGNKTLLVINSLGGNLTGSGGAKVTPISNIFGILYDDVENPRSFLAKAPHCQIRETLSISFPRIAGNFGSFISFGRTGWLELWALADSPTANFVLPAPAIIGAAINRNENAHSVANAFNGGHNLHHLTQTSSWLLIPIAPPTC